VIRTEDGMCIGRRIFGKLNLGILLSSRPLRHSPYCDLGARQLPGLGAEEAGLS
jgi:hypothetical protein